MNLVYINDVITENGVQSVLYQGVEYNIENDANGERIIVNNIPIHIHRGGTKRKLSRKIKYV